MWPSSRKKPGPPLRMTHYDALRVSPTATLLEIKAAHRSSVLRLHPDRRRDEAKELEEGERPMTLLPSSPNKRDNGIDGPSKSVERDLCRNDQEKDRAQQSQFLRVQAAWECLRDPDRRRDYDESLRRRRARTEARFDKAVVVRLSEMDCEVCDVEMDCKDFDDGDVEVLEDGHRVNESLQSANVQKVYTYPCRCGDCFEVLEEELSESPTNVTRPTLDKREQSLPGRVWECQSCSLTICIEMDVPIE